MKASLVPCTYTGNTTNIVIFKLQCPLGFATLDKAAALGLATSRAVTDLRQYINIVTLGIATSKFDFYIVNSDRSGR